MIDEPRFTEEAFEELVASVQILRRRVRWLMVGFSVATIFALWSHSLMMQRTSQCRDSLWSFAEWVQSQDPNAEFEVLPDTGKLGP